MAPHLSTAQTGPNQTGKAVEPPPPDKRTISVALAGQPNVGKTTVFNMMTG